jgi:hypothetical protein
VSVYHCPLCPVVFEDPSEVEWHVREEHRSRSGAEADLRLELAADAGHLDWGRLETLRAASGHPSVSLLLSTTPASSMTVVDVTRLRQLADQARRRLPAEPGQATVAPTVALRISTAVAAAEGSPTDRGLAVFVNVPQIAIVTLPFRPRDRTVVDRAFATRDLEYALRRYPPYRVLVLDRPPRLLEGRGRQLSEIAGIDENSSEGTGAPPAYGRRGYEERDAEWLLARQVRAHGDRPLVVLGDPRRVAEFRTRTSHDPSIIGEGRRPRGRSASLVDVAERALDEWHRDQQSKAVVDLDLANSRDEIGWGLVTAWQAVSTRVADRLWIEHDFARPGRITPGVEGVKTTGDPAEPGAIDDLVDALIAKAGYLGIPVDLLDRGTLRRPEPIAARIPISSPNLPCRSPEITVVVST